MPRIDATNNIVNQINEKTKDNPDLEDIRKAALEFQKQSVILFDKINESVEKKSAPAEDEEEAEPLNIMDFLNRGMKIAGLTGQIKTYLGKEENKTKPDYEANSAFLTQMLGLLDNEMENQYAIQLDFNTNTLKSDAQLDAEKKVAAEPEKKDGHENNVEAEPKNNVKAEPENNTEIEPEKKDAEKEPEIDFLTKEELDTTFVMDHDEEMDLDTGIVTSKNKVLSSIDDVIENLDLNEQFTGSRQYTRILNTLKSLKTAEKMLDKEFSENGETGELYEEQKAGILKQKKDLLIDMEKYIERKNIEKENAAFKNKKENGNSKDRREAMEEARAFLENDIEITEKAAGIEKKDDFYEKMVLNMEYGNRLTKGKKAYNDILAQAKIVDGMDRSPVNFQKTYKAEIKLGQLLQDYLEPKAKSLKGKNGYEFSLNGGKDGKRPPKNNTEKRFKIMLDAYTDLCNRTIQNIAKYDPENLPKMKDYMKQANERFGISINTDIKPAVAKDYKELMEFKQASFSMEKSRFLKDEKETKKGYDEKQAEEVSRRRKLLAEKRAENPTMYSDKKFDELIRVPDKDFDFFDEDYDRLNRNLGITKQQEEAFKGYKFNTFKINDLRKSAEEMLFIDAQAKNGAKYDPKTYEMDKSDFTLNLSPSFTSNFYMEVGDALNLDKNDSKAVKNFKLDEKTVAGLKDIAFEKEVKNIVDGFTKDSAENNNTNYKNYRERIDSLTKTAKMLGMEKHLDKKLEYNGKETSINDIFKDIKEANTIKKPVSKAATMIKK